MENLYKQDHSKNQANDSLNMIDTFDISLRELSSGSSKICSDSDCSLCELQAENDSYLLLDLHTPDVIKSCPILPRRSNNPRCRHNNFNVGPGNCYNPNISIDSNQNPGNFCGNMRTDILQQENMFYYRRPFPLLHQNNDQNLAPPSVMLNNYDVLNEILFETFDSYDNFYLEHPEQYYKSAEDYALSSFK